MCLKFPFGPIQRDSLCYISEHNMNEFKTNFAKQTFYLYFNQTKDKKI